MGIRHAEPAADDRELVLSFQDGDQAAYDSIYRRYGPMAERICRRYLINPHDAEEASQETMLRVLRSLPSFNGRYALRAWVARIATNVCLDRLRHDGRRGGEELNDVLPEPVQNGNGHSDDHPEDVLERVAQREEIRAHLARLPETHRIALVLREVEGLGHREIAAILHTTPAKVKALLHRARRGFQRTWGPRDRTLGVFVPVTSFLGWLRRFGGKVHEQAARVQEAGASAFTNSPAATSLATAGGDHVSTAIAAVVLAGSIGLAPAGSPPAVSAEARPQPQETVVIETATATTQLTQLEAPEKERRRADRPAVQPLPSPVPSATPEPEPTEPVPTGSPSSVQKPEEAVIPEPAPSPTIRPAPPQPPAFTFGFYSDWLTTAPCACSDSPEVVEQQVIATGGHLSYVSGAIAGGAVRDRNGQPAWPVELSLSSDTNANSLDFVVHTDEGDLTYVASATAFAKERTAWGGWTYRFAGTYELADGSQPPAMYPSGGSYEASLTVAVREGRLVDVTVTLGNGEYAQSE